MKIKRFMAMMIAAATLCGGVTSCGDDEDEDDVPNQTDIVPSLSSLAEMISGNYSGVLTTKVAGQVINDTLAFEIKDLDDTHVNVVIPSTSFGTNTLPIITIDSIMVSPADSVIVASIEKIEGVVTVDGEEKTYSLSNISLNAANNNVDVKYTLQYGKMPMSMECEFVGTK